MEGILGVFEFGYYYYYYVFITDKLNYVIYIDE